MKELNLLFLAPHWRVALIRSFQTAKDRSGCLGKLVGADSDPFAPSMQVVDVEYCLPAFGDVTCKQVLLDICQRESIHTILPMTNKAVEFLDRHRHEFKQKNILAYLQDADTIEICHDKLKLSDFFKARKIPSPVTGGSGFVLPLYRVSADRQAKAGRRR